MVDHQTSRGRFAPSPTGTLHVGNVRTALAASALARADGGSFLVRFEDLDRVTSSRDIATQQLRDLESVGVVSDSEPVFQSERFDLYEGYINRLVALGLTYECFCSRKEIHDAAQAPHGNQMLYPGTCRDLSEGEREKRRLERSPALRLRSSGEVIGFTDLILGDCSAVVDDVVLRRNDGVPAYNLAVVVDDELQGITEVVRGDDLVGITPSQIHLQRLLGFSTPTYCHVPLVLGVDGERLAKRHGAVSLADLAADGHSADDVRASLWSSLGQTGDAFDLSLIPREPYVWRGM
jgi:glutamyl-tRNA synthetase